MVLLWRLKSTDYVSHLHNDFVNPVIICKYYIGKLWIACNHYRKKNCSCIAHWRSVGLISMSVDFTIKPLFSFQLAAFLIEWNLIPNSYAYFHLAQYGKTNLNFWLARLSFAFEWLQKCYHGSDNIGPSELKFWLVFVGGQLVGTAISNGTR